MIISKKIKYLTFSLLPVLLVVSLIFTTFYLGRISIYEPIIIKVKTGNHSYGKIAKVDAVQPMGKTVQLSYDSVKGGWLIDKGYYRELIIHLNSEKKFNNLPSVKIEIYSLADNSLLKSMSYSLTGNRTIVIKDIRDEGKISFLSKVIPLVFGQTNFIWIAIFSFILVFLLRKKNVHNNILKIILVLFICWSFGWLILASFYSFPNSEDLSYSACSKNFGILSAVNTTFSFGDGRYFTNFLYAINPLAWGSLYYYKLIPIVSLSLILLSLTFFIRSLFGNNFKLHLALLSAALLLVYHFAAIDSLPHDLYWMTSSFPYFYPWIFLFFWLGFFLLYLRAQKTIIKSVYFLLSVIFMISGYGTNEIMLVINGFALMSILFYLFIYVPQKKFDIIPYFIVAIACSYFVIMAPGTGSRYNESPVNRDFSYLLELTTKSSFEFIKNMIRWLIWDKITIPMVLIITLILNKNKKNFAEFISLGHLVIFGLSLSFLLFAVIFIYHFTSASVIHPERLCNFENWIFMFIAFLITPLILIRLKMAQKPWFLKYRSHIITFFLIFTFFQTIFSDNNLSTIRKEFRSGTYEAYTKELYQRYAVIQKTKKMSGWKCAVIDSLHTTPKAIYCGPDLSITSLNLWEKAYASYFNLDQVKVKGVRYPVIKEIQQYAEK